MENEEQKAKTEDEFYTTVRAVNMTLKSVYVARNACLAQADQLQIDIDKMASKRDRLTLVGSHLDKWINRVEENKTKELEASENDDQEENHETSIEPQEEIKEEHVV